MVPPRSTDPQMRNAQAAALRHQRLFEFWWQSGGDGDRLGLAQALSDQDDPTPPDPAQQAVRARLALASAPQTLADLAQAAAASLRPQTTPPARRRGPLAALLRRP